MSVTSSGQKDVGPVKLSADEVVSMVEASMDEKVGKTSPTNQTVAPDLANKGLISSEWGQSRIKIAVEEIEPENDFSSIDSFPLVDSPEGTIVSSHGTSSQSSQSSLSGMMFLSSTSNGGSTGSRSLRQSQGSHSRNGSATLSFGSTNSKSGKSELNRLKSQGAKFGSRHNAGKVSYLRMTLLPYLRKHQTDVIAPHASNELILAQKVFSIWWDNLLAVLRSNFKNVNGIDRDAFYEAISSILERPEWADCQMQPSYQSLLSQTTSHVLSKCASSLNLSISQSAFAGKVLVYAYTYLPGMSTYLLRLLDFTPSAVQRVIEGGINKLVNGHQSLLEADSMCFSSTPQHLKPLIGALGSPSYATNDRAQLSRLFNESSKGWERHFTIDSVLFASFFKHYCTLQSQLLQVNHQVDVEIIDDDGIARPNSGGEIALLSSPGMLLILAAIVNSLDKISNDTSRILSSRSANPYSVRSPSAMTSTGKSSPSSATERVRIDQLKIFTAIREILHCDEATVPFFLVFSRTFDRIFRAIALETRVHDLSGCVIVCDIAEEWFSSLMSVNATKAAGIINNYKHLVLDWKFWLSVAKRMMKSDNFHTEIRALSFLFNIWPHLPNQDIANSTSSGNIPVNCNSIMREATEWIISTEVWNHMFCHWCPLVRSYYHRFLSYRLASVGTDNSSWYLDVDSAEYLAETREMLKKKLAESYFWCETLSSKAGMKPELCPSLPMPRLRVGIRTFGPMPSMPSAKPETNLTRVYPFDVYDSVAYLQPDVVQEESVCLSPVTERRSSTESTSSFRSVTAAAQNESYEQSERSTSIGSPYARGIQESSNGLEKDYTIKKSHSSDTVSDYGSTKNKARGLLQRRLSFVGSIRQFTGDNESLCNTNRARKEETSVEDVSKDQKPALQKRFSFLRKLLPNRKTAPSTLDSLKLDKCPNNLDMTLAAKDSEHNMRPSSALLHPPRLAQLRPDITRSQFRFVMVPTSIRPPSRNDLAPPRLPFSSDVCIRDCFFDAEKRDEQKDLAMWNYGGRSLAEWSIEVICFERFAQQQRQVVGDTLDMFPVPFMVTEIPWRTIG